MGSGAGGDPGDVWTGRERSGRGEDELAAFRPGRLFSSAQYGRDRGPPRPSPCGWGGGFWSAAPGSHTSSITPETPPSFKRQRRDHSARTPPSQPPQEEDEDEDGLWREKICLNAHSASKKATFKV